MTTTSVHTPTAPFDDLAATLRGDLIRPGDADYDAARAVYNGHNQHANGPPACTTGTPQGRKEPPCPPT